MCRIAGIIDKELSLLQIEKEVKAMCAIMAHGGPDDNGTALVNKYTVFGHRRLSIIDLTSAGHQPMVKEHLTISFNGEIYNYQILRSELIGLNFEFSTETDTEVLLMGFKAWGTRLFNKLEGMFAFALYDKSVEKTYLVRDQSGIKPLYYYSKNEKLIFSSEMKAFGATTYCFDENKDWKIYFLAFGHIPHPFTTLKDVKSIPGGSYLVWDNHKNIFKINKFYEEIYEKKIFNSPEARETVEKYLKKAVNHHLISDAKIGVFLSGGIDSSILTLIANDVVKKKLNTLSVNFNEKEFSEEDYQQKIVKLTYGQHFSYRVKEDDFNNYFDEIMSAMDQPTSDGINTWFVNKYAKDCNLKAVLSGIGADELFGGYPSFKRMILVKYLKKLPRFILKLSVLFPSDKISRIYYLNYKNPIGEYLFLRGLFIPKVISKILNVNVSVIDQLFENFPIEKNLEKLTNKERAAWFETNLFMKNQLLKDTDFMSMAHGIEVRVPFLDQQFLAAINQISNLQRFKIQPKGLLINAFKNILPKYIWDRKKMGFSFPLQQWFLSGGQITDESIYINDHNKSLIAKFKSGKMHWSKAFALYQVCSSKQLFIKKSKLR